MGRITVIRRKPKWKVMRKGKRLTAHKRISKWSAKDRGKRGRTRKQDAWSRKIKDVPSHKMDGYEAKLSAKTRRRILAAEVRERAQYGAARYKSLGKTKEGALSTSRSLQKIVNLNPSRKSDRAMKADIKYLKRKYKI